MEGPLAWDEGNDDLCSPLFSARNPFVALLQPVFKVLQEELGPGELDAAACVCKAWATQLSHDVVHCEMCVPASYELLRCQLEQVIRRFTGVHSWKLWLPAGRDWTAVEELNLLRLLSKYNAETLQLDGLLNWNTKDRDLPTLRADVLLGLSSLRSLQTLTLNHCTLADLAGLRYLSDLPNLRYLTFGITANSDKCFHWPEIRSASSLLAYLRKLQQVVEIEIHVEGAEQLPEALGEQIRQVFAGHTRLQRCRFVLGKGWGIISNCESLVLERVSAPDGRTDWLATPVSSTAAAAATASSAPAAGVQQQQNRRMRWLEMMDPSAARAAAAAGLDLSSYAMSDSSEPNGSHITAGRSQSTAGSSYFLNDDSDDDSCWPSPPAFTRPRVASDPREEYSHYLNVMEALHQRKRHGQQRSANAADAHTATAQLAADPVPDSHLSCGVVREPSTVTQAAPGLPRLEIRASQQLQLHSQQQQQQQQQPEETIQTSTVMAATPDLGLRQTAQAAESDATAIDVQRCNHAARDLPTDAAEDAARQVADVPEPAPAVSLAADMCCHSPQDDCSNSDAEQQHSLMQRVGDQHRLAVSDINQGDAAAADGSNGNERGAEQVFDAWAHEPDLQLLFPDDREFANLFAAMMTAAQQSAAATAPLQRPQFNDCLVKPDSMLVTHLKLVGLSGPAGLHHRLQQQLSGSPAIALQDLELHFDKASFGGGEGPGSCFAVQGLTKLCFDMRKGTYKDPLRLDEPPAAAATQELILDALFVQVITCRLQGLRSLEFHGEILASKPPSYTDYTIRGGAGPRQTAHHPSGSSNSRRTAMDPSQPALIYLTRMTNLTSLSLDHQPLYSSSPVSRRHSAQLDMAWLPAGLTRLQLANIAISCHEQRSVSSAAAAASYMALLLQQRRANTPDAVVAAAAAAVDEKGKQPVNALPTGIAAALGSQGRAGSNSSSSSDTMRCMMHTKPPVILRNLQELELDNCDGVQAAVIGCLAHSTDLKVLSLSVTDLYPEPVGLAAIAWMWPRLQTIELTTPSNGPHRDTSAAAAAAEGAQGGSGHKLLPDLLDPSVTPELAAAWLWRLATPHSSVSGSSSSAAAASVRARLLADICSRGSRSPSWADPADFKVFAASLPNLCKLKLMLSNNSECSKSGSDTSSSLFWPRHLLELVHAQSLRELTVTLPTQPEHQAAADIMSLTQLSKLRLLDLTCKTRTARVAGNVSVQTNANTAVSAAGVAAKEVAATPPTGYAAATQSAERTAAAAAAALGQGAAVAVAADAAAPQPAPPAVAAAPIVEVRPLRPSELLAEMRANMPNTSVFLSIF